MHEHVCIFPEFNPSKRGGFKSGLTTQAVDQELPHRAVIQADDPNKTKALKMGFFLL